MEKYIGLVLLAAPGFIASHISNVLGVTSARKGEFETLGGYLSYSFFAVLLTICISILTGMLKLNSTWSTMATEINSVGFTLKILIIGLISGVITGILWALLLKKIIMKVLNKINIKTGRNKRYTNGSLFNRLFADGKEHFIIVSKDGRDIAVGFIYSASDPLDNRMELSVTEYPEYREELKKAREKDVPSPLKNILQTYVDIENNIVITETEYPPAWINGNYSAV